MKSHLDPSALLLGYAPARSASKTIGFSQGTTSLPPPTEQPVLHPSNSGPLFILGRSSSGKGVSALIPYALQAPIDTTLVIVDVKSEISAVTAEYRRRKGARVLIIDPYAQTAGTSSMLNPLDLIGDPATSLSAADDAAVLADALVVESPIGERFWDMASKNAITAGCLLLAAHAPDELKNLGALADALGSGVGSTLSAFLAAGLCTDICGGLVRRECENLASMAPQTISSLTATLASHLRPLSSPLVKSSLARSSFDLNEFTDGEPLTLYLTVPADKVRASRSLIRVWLNTIITMIARRRERPKTRTLLLIDELPALGTLEAVRLGSYMLRSYGCDLVLCAQAVDQLARLYAEDWQALLDNAGGILSLSGGAALRRLVQITVGEEEARALPDLPSGQAAHIRDGSVGFINKIDYRNDPAFNHLAQLNKFFHSGEISHGR